MEILIGERLISGKRIWQRERTTTTKRTAR